MIECQCQLDFSGELWYYMLTTYRIPFSPQRYAPHTSELKAQRGHLAIVISMHTFRQPPDTSRPCHHYRYIALTLTSPRGAPPLAPPTHTFTRPQVVSTWHLHLWHLHGPPPPPHSQPTTHIAYLQEDVVWNYILYPR